MKRVLLLSVVTILMLCAVLSGCATKENETKTDPAKENEEAMELAEEALRKLERECFFDPSLGLAVHRTYDVVKQVAPGVFLFKVEEDALYNLFVVTSASEGASCIRLRV